MILIDFLKEIEKRDFTCREISLTAQNRQSYQSSLREFNIFVKKCQNLVLPDTDIVVSPTTQFQKARPQSKSSHSHLPSKTTARGRWRVVSRR